MLNEIWENWISVLETKSGSTLLANEITKCQVKFIQRFA